MKRIFALFLCIVMVLSCVPVVGSAQEDTLTVYLDNVAGVDTNDGLTEATAVKTFGGAYKVLYTQMPESTATKAKIMLTSDYAYAFSSTSFRRDIASSDYLHTYGVTICGKTPDVKLTFKLAVQSYLGLIGPTTFENITMCLANDTSNSYLSIHGRGGSYLKIGDNVTTTTDSKKTISLSAAPYFNTSKKCDLEVNSGAWRNLYASAYTGSVTVKNKVSLTMNGGCADKIATVYNGTQQGDVSITINGGTVGIFETAALNTGTVTGNVTTTINGGTINSDITCKGLTGENTVILAPTNGVKLNGGTVVYVNQLTGGDLTLGTGTGLVVTQAVTGTTSITVEGGIDLGQYLTAPQNTDDSAIVFTQGTLEPKVVAGQKIWGNTDTAQMRGLQLQAAKDVKVELYTEFADGEKVNPDMTLAEGDMINYYFLNLSGKYRYTASGTGYYSITKNVYISPEEAKTMNIMDVTPGTTTGAGWEASVVKQATDELMQNRPADASLWPEYQEAFQTPFFINNHRDHQFTTQQEMVEFLQQLAETDPNMYIFSAGQSGYGLDIPLVIFTATDLSGAKTVEEAAALIRANGKLTVHYQGQMHGNEPAGGEGALAMVKKLSGSYGDKVLQNLNIYVIPRLNPDGSQRNKRTVTATGMDMNRDYLLMKSVETKNAQYIAQIFEPTLMIDSHEYNAGTDLSTDLFGDVLISPGFHTFNTDQFRETSIAMTQGVFAAMAEQNLTYTYYSSDLNSKSAYIGRNYASSKGVLFFLLETRGIEYGSNIYGRRVVSHLVSATQLIDYAYENHQQLMEVVAQEQAHIVEIGSTYDTSNQIALSTTTSKHPEYNLSVTKFYTDTGKSFASTIATTIYDVLSRSRVAPTAYVIPAGESWNDAILELMDRHGITYTLLPAGAMIQLQQYGGTTSSATLTEEKAVTFTNGAYVFTMNQVGGRILANLMEPDVSDISAGNSTLVMAGMIPSDGTNYALYRYACDLNDQGFVDYLVVAEAPSGLTVQKIPAIGQSGAILGLDSSKLYEYCYENGTYTQLPAGTTSITVTEAGTYYVRFQATQTQPASNAAEVVVGYEKLPEYVIYLSVNGSDSNTGISADKAVATIAQAYSNLESLLTGAPQGTNGKIVVEGIFDLGTAVYEFPSHSYPVVITGKTVNDGFSYKGGGSDKTTVVNFNGDTTLEYLTLKLTSTINFNYIGAKGHKLVMGKGLNCVANSKGVYFNLCGGSFSGTYNSTDLTVKSGKWRNIYYGTYAGTVNGDAKFTMTGGSYTNYVQANYSGTVNGDCTVYMAGCKLGSLLVGGNKSAGTVRGDITVTLGAGVTGVAEISPVAGTATYGGTFTLVIDGADTTGMTIKGSGDSKLLLKNGVITTFTDMTQVTLAGAIKLGSDITSPMTVEGDSVLDLNGKVLTGTISGSGTLFGMDTATDSYTASNGRITGTVSCNVASGYKDPQTLKRYLSIADAQGYTFHRFYMGITHMSLRPSSDGVGYKAVFYGDDAVKQQVAAYGYSLWLDGSDKKLTAQKDGAFTSGQTLTLLLKNYDVENYGETALNGFVFITLKDGAVIESVTYSMTLRSLVEQLNAKAEELTAQQLEAVKNMIARYDSIMSYWNVDNLI